MIVAENLDSVVGQFADNVVEDFSVEHDGAGFRNFGGDGFFNACFEIISADGQFVFGSQQ